MKKEKNMKQSELAERLGVTNKTVSRWEIGKYMPDLSVFTEISKILGITINELLEEERLIKRKNSNSIEIEIKLEINYKIYEYISEHLLEVGVANNIIRFAKIKIFTFCEVNAIIYLR